MSGPVLLFATHNRGKLRELRALTAGLGLDLRTLDDLGLATDVVEDRDTFAGNSRKKAEEIAAATGLLTLADDSGLEVDALGGRPGVHSARFGGEPRSDERNRACLIAALQHTPPPRPARFRCVLTLAAPYDPVAVLAVEEGACEGEIVLEPRGDNGFGYDPLFLIPRLGRTLAELPLDEKNTLSHRALAMRRMAARLPSVLQALPPWLIVRRPDGA